MQFRDLDPQNLIPRVCCVWRIQVESCGSCLEFGHLVSAVLNQPGPRCQYWRLDVYEAILREGVSAKRDSGWFLSALCRSCPASCSGSRPGSSHPNQLNLFSCYFARADGSYNSMGPLAHVGWVTGVLRRGRGRTRLADRKASAETQLSVAGPSVQGMPQIHMRLSAPRVTGMPLSTCIILLSLGLPVCKTGMKNTLYRTAVRIKQESLCKLNNTIPVT